MTDPNSPRYRRPWRPTLGELVMVFPAVAVALHPSGLGVLLNDGDTGWHIRTGEWILANGGVPRTDLFSFTKPGEPWFAWEWLWDAGAALLHGAFGLTGVALATLFLLCTVYGVLYRQGLARCGNPVVAAGVTMLAMAVSMGHWLARPHAVSLLLLAAATWWIRRGLQNRERTLLWLVPLTVVWVNMHGAFVMLVLVLGAFAAGALLDGLLAGPGAARRTLWRRAALLIGTAMACAAASLLNPYGWRLHQHLAAYLQEPLWQQRVIEFRPPDLAAPRMALLLVLDAAALLFFMWRRRPAEVLLLGGTGYMALSSVRHVSIHAVVAAPLLCQAIGAMVRWGTAKAPGRALRAGCGELETIGREWAAVEWRWRALALPVAVAALWVVAAVAPLAPKFRAHFPRRIFALDAVASLAASNQELRIFDDGRPGFVIYALWPRARVFWDGRLDFYGTAMFRTYDQIRGAEPGWQRILDDTGTDTMLVHADTPVARALRDEPGWRRTYADGRFVVFRNTAVSRQPSAISHQP
jgi:hypothetical protein